MRHANTIRKQADQHDDSIEATHALPSIYRCNYIRYVFVATCNLYMLCLYLVLGKWSVGSTIIWKRPSLTTRSTRSTRVSIWSGALTGLRKEDRAPLKHITTYLVDQGKGNLASDFALSHYKRLSVSLRSVLLASCTWANKLALKVRTGTTPASTSFDPHKTEARHMIYLLSDALDIQVEHFSDQTGPHRPVYFRGVRDSFTRRPELNQVASSAIQVRLRRAVFATVSSVW